MQTRYIERIPVGDPRSCYRLKLFLEKFSIASAVLNAELPANSRAHCLTQFNKVLLGGFSLLFPVSWMIVLL